MPQGGSELLKAHYRSLTGDIYDAEVRATNADGTFDIDVIWRGTVWLSLRKIRRGAGLGQLVEGE